MFLSLTGWIIAGEHTISIPGTIDTHIDLFLYNERLKLSVAAQRRWLAALQFLLIAIE
ncbi:MAG: hypothetical protein WAZ77_10000 [Candidatus Nitrosopolaris sp.]